jgi:hypothetical protein
MRMPEMNSGLQRAWFQLALVVSVLAGLLWIKYSGARALRDWVGYLFYTGAVIVVSYHCLRSINARRQHSAAPGECVVLARSRSPSWFYVGIVGVGSGLILNAFVLVNLIFQPGQFEDRLASAQRGGFEVHLWLGVSLCFFALGFLFSWLGAYQVRVAAQLLENWSLFGGYESIHFDDIKLARVKGGMNPNRSPVRLEIVPTPASNARMLLIINLKVLRQTDVNLLLQWLAPKLKD